MTKWLSSVRGGRLIVLGGLLALAFAATALAFFSSTGTGSASAATSALSAPTGLAGTPGAGTVALSWQAVTPPASGPVTYYLTRNAGTPGGNCPAATAPASGTTCTDSGLSPGTYHYTVTAVALMVGDQRDGQRHRHVRRCHQGRPVGVDREPGFRDWADADRDDRGRQRQHGDDGSR